jgi:hypothetical protein
MDVQGLVHLSNFDVSYSGVVLIEQGNGLEPSEIGGHFQV